MDPVHRAHRQSTAPYAVRVACPGAWFVSRCSVGCGSRCFETMVEDLRLLLREFSGRKAQPTAMILDSRTIQSTPESGAGPVTTELNGARARRCIRRSIRWATRWLSM
jgi:hypothetical protein